MSVSTYDSNSVTPSIIGTEQTLKSINVIGEFSLKLDLNNMASGDWTIINVYQMVKTGGTARLIKSYSFSGVPQTVINWESDRFRNDLTDTDSLMFKINQYLGTARAYPWDVMRDSDAEVLAGQTTIAGYIDTEVAAIKTQTDKMVFTVTNQLDVNVLDWKGATAPAMTGDAFARLGAPAGASVSADIAAVKTDTGTTIPGRLPAALVSGRMSADVGSVNGATAPANGLEKMFGLTVIGTAAAGNVNQITLAAPAAATAQLYRGWMIYLTGGAGANQYAFVADYTAGRVATVWPPFNTAPDNTTTFALIPMGRADVVAWVDEAVQGQTSSLINVRVNSTGSGAITAASFAAGAIDNAAIATDAIGSAELAASAVTEIQSGLATAASIVTAQADLDDIQIRLPAALVSGRMDASVGAMAANVLTATAIATDAITAAKIAADAIGASELAADAVTEIQSGLMLAASYTAPLDAAGTRAAVGLAAANLDTQLGAIDDFVDTEVAAIKTQTDKMVFTVTNQLDVNVLDWKGATAPAMTGDAFARLGAPAGASVSADVAAVKADTATLIGRLTAARAGYLDNLNVGGAVASQADINALNQSASRRIILTSVEQYERPETGSTDYDIEVRTYDADGAAVAADTDPTLTATGIVSGDLSANLSAVSNPATGVYRWTYNVASTDTIEQIRFDASATLASSTFTLSLYAQVVNFVAANWTSTDASNLTAIFNKLPSKSHLTGSNNADGDIQLDEATGGLNAAAKADVNAEADTALADYDGPTHAEMTAELATADDPTLAAIAALPVPLTAAGTRTAVGLASANLDAQLGVIDDYLDTEVAAIKAKTDALPTDPADQSLLIAATDAIAAAVAALNDFDPASDTVAHVTLVDTTTDVTNGSSLDPQDVSDAVWDAVMADHLDSGSTGASLNGAGSAGDPWNTALPGAYGAGSAGFLVGTNLDAPVSAVPTNAELATALGTLNNLSAAQAQTAAAAALAAYDAPTHAEMTSELATADDAVLAAVNDLPTNAELATALAGLNNLSAAQAQTAAAAALAAYDGPTHAEMTAELATADDAVLAAVGALNDVSTTDLANAVLPVKIVTDKLGGMIEHHLTYDRFTDNALEEAPAGGGGGGSTAADVWSFANRTLTSMSDVVVHVDPLDPKTLQLTLVGGDSYTDDVSRPIHFGDPGWWPVLDDADSLTMFIRVHPESEDIVETDATSIAGPPQVLSVDLSSARTTLNEAHNNRYLYRVEARYDTERVTLAYGPLVIIRLTE